MIFFETDCHRGLIDPHAAHLFIEREFNGDWIVTLDYRAPNLMMLSESFRDAVGYGPAVEALIQNGVPHDSLLWTLGHKGGDTHWRRG